MLSSLKDSLHYACCLWLLIEGAITAFLSDSTCQEQEHTVKRALLTPNYLCRGQQEVRYNTPQ